MNDANGPYVVASLLWLVLVVSALAARRVPIGQTAKMAIAWVGIFALVFGLFSFRNEFSMVGQRMKSELLGTPMVVGEEVQIAMADDGHFWTVATVNGHQARFLVDSGATTTTVSGELADEIGLVRSSRSAMIDTANGTVAMPLSEGDVTVGSIERPDLGILINERDSENVIGMNFLSSLRSWRVEGKQLILQP